MRGGQGPDLNRWELAMQFGRRGSGQRVKMTDPYSDIVAPALCDQ